MSKVKKDQIQQITLKRQRNRVAINNNAIVISCAIAMQHNITLQDRYIVHVNITEKTIVLTKSINGVGNTLKFYSTGRKGSAIKMVLPPEQLTMYASLAQNLEVADFKVAGDTITIKLA